jgi:hypothetical protein
MHRLGAHGSCHSRSALCTASLPTDPDQCTLGTDNCDGNAACINTAAGFTCTCKPGFQGNGASCSGEQGWGEASGQAEVKPLMELSASSE